MHHRARTGGGRSRVWSDALRQSFLTLLEETGNARASARALGHKHLFNNRMRRDPDFRRDCLAAIAAADARLGNPATPFLPSIAVKSMPDEPGEKRRDPVIRRTSNGKTQISYVREGGWSSVVEAEFLAQLRLSGNAEACARAVGFHPTTVYRRMDQWPAFARDCAAALDEASTRLDYKLVAHAHALLRKPGDADGEDDPDVPFDPEKAMRILGFIDRRRAGNTTRGRRKGPPDRTFEEAVESILEKIAAIKRHKQLMQERGEQQE